jgi:hypothetical protein
VCLIWINVSARQQKRSARTLSLLTFPVHLQPQQRIECCAMNPDRAQFAIPPWTFQRHDEISFFASEQLWPLDTALLKEFVINWSPVFVR